MPTFLVLSADVPSTVALLMTTGALVLAVPLFHLLRRHSRPNRPETSRQNRHGDVSFRLGAQLHAHRHRKHFRDCHCTGLPLVIALSLLASALLVILEMMPTHARFTGTAIPYNIAYALFAGTAPLVCAALVNATGSDLSPAFYATAIALIALPILWRGIPENEKLVCHAGQPDETFLTTDAPRL